LFVFVNNNQMINLNCRFKGSNKTTDVLAFNLAESNTNNYIDGEVYVNLQIARIQAVDFKVDYLEEVVRLCLHGFLHILGYNDLKPTDKRNMWQIQEHYLTKYL